MAKIDQRLGDLADELADYAAVAHGSANGRRYGARLSLEAPTPDAAVAQGVTVFRKAAKLSRTPGLGRRPRRGADGG